VVETQDGRVNRRAATLHQKALRRSIAIAAQPRLVRHSAASRTSPPGTLTGSAEMSATCRSMLL
jgi:hypothetical protein